MTRLDRVEESNKSVWNVCIKYDTREEHWKLSIIEENHVGINGKQCREKTTYIDKVRA